MFSSHLLSSTTRIGNMYSLSFALGLTLATSCQPGQGPSGKDFWRGDVGTQADCDAQCAAHSSCAFYDFTSRRTDRKDACRLFSSEFGSRTDPGGDSRIFCNAGETSKYSVHYHCSQGQGADGKYTKVYNSASELHCAFDCKNDNSCHFFDYTTKSQGDNCRFYDGMFGGRTDPGSAHRQYCAVTTQDNSDAMV